jgi:hypothetical protein
LHHGLAVYSVRVGFIDDDRDFPMTSAIPDGSTPGNLSSEGQDRRLRNRRLMRRFAVGFLVVFVGMCFGVKMETLTRSGRAVFPCTLWQYYLIEIYRAWSSGRTLGFTSGSAEAAMVTAMEHVLTSVLGGAVAAGVGWMIDKVRNRLSSGRRSPGVPR